MTEQYLFKSERLGFRNWLPQDLNAMSMINADAAVMEHFAKTQSKDDTANFMTRMQAQYASKKFCYFAVEILATNEFIGFIGLSQQSFDVDFSPYTDIGWRLSRASWGKGYATEGARRCLDYAFDTLRLKEILSTAPKTNTPSIAVMEKIGMTKIKEFAHPMLSDHPKLENCVLYAKEADR
jgi:RimJ/RimL family protein N-acetyltransferase